MLSTARRVTLSRNTYKFNFTINSKSIVSVFCWKISGTLEHGYLLENDPMAQGSINGPEYTGIQIRSLSLIYGHQFHRAHNY